VPTAHHEARLWVGFPLAKGVDGGKNRTAVKTRVEPLVNNGTGEKVSRRESPETPPKVH